MQIIIVSILNSYSNYWLLQYLKISASVAIQILTLRAEKINLNSWKTAEMNCLFKSYEEKKGVVTWKAKALARYEYIIHKYRLAFNKHYKATYICDAWLNSKQVNVLGLCVSHEDLMSNIQFNIQRKVYIIILFSFDFFPIFSFWPLNFLDIGLVIVLN